jgi:hypothetical protein
VCKSCTNGRSNISPHTSCKALCRRARLMAQPGASSGELDDEMRHRRRSS